MGVKKMKGHTNPNVRTTSENEIVGPKMHSAIERVRKREYHSMHELAISVGPNGSSKYGYRIVKRCLKKDLLALDDTHPKAKGRGKVIITQKGINYLKE